MASKPLIVHRLADQEAAEAARYYGKIDPGLSVRFIDKLEAALADVDLQPELRAVDAAGDRRRLLDTFPYAVVYREMTTVWLVVAVAHGRRRPGYWRLRERRP